MSDSSSPLDRVRARIHDAEHRFGRTPRSVQLVAVSKRRSVAEILAAAGGGQRVFGENYVQEALPKIAALRAHGFEWHHIGVVQANKTREIAANFSWVHAVDRVKIARRLADQRPDGVAALNVCIEVNVSGERSKAGVGAAEAAELAAAIAALPNLRLRGLMALPEPETDFLRQRAAFRRVAEIFAGIALPGMDTLSMGTTADFEAAIAEGATIVRIGTAIFGPRERAVARTSDPGSASPAKR